MDNERLTPVTAYVGAVLLVATAVYHLSAYSWVVSQTPADLRALVAALWVAGGLGLVLAALLVVAAAPAHMPRRGALLGIAALTPLSMAVLQIVYIGFMLPTAILLLDTVVVLAAAAPGLARRVSWTAN